MCSLGQCGLFFRLGARVRHHIPANTRASAVRDVYIAMLYLVRYIPDALRESFAILSQAARHAVQVTKFFSLLNVRKHTAPTLDCI